jgi:hypothetical protein
MITKIITVEELKQIFTEILLNKTDKISDVSNESVLNGIAYGCGKLAQRLLVNQAVVESHIFPDTAHGNYLDKLAELRGISQRNTSTGSTVYIRIEGESGSTYNKDLLTFVSSSGIQFTLEEDLTLDSNGWGYAKAKSVQSGSTSNVDALTINTIQGSGVPSGHIACTNEYRAVGGSDEEDDDTFRVRIKESVNQLARTTLSYIEQVFMKINSRVLRVYKGGVDEDNKFNLILVSVNGQDFTDAEFNEILSKSEEYLSLNELLVDTNDFSLKLNNVDWLPVDVDFRVNLDPSYDVDDVRRQMQIKISKLFDYRYWQYGDKIEWENILYSIRSVDGVKYIPDNHFYPQADVNVPKYRLPRLRSFIMRDLDGNIIIDDYSVLSAFNYPNDPDSSYQSSVLSSI